MTRIAPWLACVALVACGRGPHVTLLAGGDGASCYASVGTVVRAQSQLVRQEPMPWHDETSAPPGDRVQLRVVAEPGRGCERVSCEIQVDGRTVARSGGIHDANCAATMPASSVSAAGR